MVSLVKTWMIVVFSFTFISSCKQDNKRIDEFLCKKWKPVAQERGGQKYDMQSSMKENRIIYYSDHTVKSIQPNSIKTGVWKYDKTTRILTMTDSETQYEITAKIVEITDTSFIYQIGESPQKIVTVYMIPDIGE